MADLLYPTYSSPVENDSQIIKVAMDHTEIATPMSVVNACDFGKGAPGKTLKHTGGKA